MIPTFIPVVLLFLCLTSWLVTAVALYWATGIRDASKDALRLALRFLDDSILEKSRKVHTAEELLLESASRLNAAVLAEFATRVDGFLATHPPTRVHAYVQGFDGDFLGVVGFLDTHLPVAAFDPTRISAEVGVRTSMSRDPARDAAALLSSRLVGRYMDILVARMREAEL